MLARVFDAGHVGIAMGALQSVSVDEVVRRGSIKDSDVARLRAAYYDDGVILSDEADTLFKLNGACAVKDPSWADFFVEAITDYIVNQTRPEGYITRQNADWLVARISKDGKIETKTELEVLLTVLDKARWSPPSLVRFALNQVKNAVLSGDGPLRASPVLEKATISETDVELLRRMLYAFGGDGSVAVTRAEAEILFDINEALADSAANPAWVEFFTKAIANVVMAASGYGVPTREEALRHEALPGDSDDKIPPLSMLRAMVTSSLDSVWEAYTDQSPEEQALARLERQRLEIITNEEITEGEATWLAERLGRDGQLSTVELALVDYLYKESRKIHPALQDCVARLSKAA